MFKNKIIVYNTIAVLWIIGFVSLNVWFVYGAYIFNPAWYYLMGILFYLTLVPYGFWKILIIKK